MSDSDDIARLYATVLAAGGHLRRWVEIHDLADLVYRSFPEQIRGLANMGTWEIWSQSMAIALATQPPELRLQTRQALNEFLNVIDATADAHGMPADEARMVQVGIEAMQSMGTRSKRQLKLWQDARGAGSKGFLVLVYTGSKTEIRFTTEMEPEVLRRLGLERAIRP